MGLPSFPISMDNAVPTEDAAKGVRGVHGIFLFASDSHFETTAESASPVG